MKIKKTHTAILQRMLCLALLPLLATSCLYEQPQLTGNGELGVDPTGVNVNLNLALDLKIDEAAATRTNTRADEPTTVYRHRIIVDAYQNRQLAMRQVIYKDRSAGAEETSVNVNMKLHARDYRLVVWADYVEAGSEADIYYNTTTLVPAINTEPYTGNAEYKDVLYASRELPLSRYRNEWDKQENIKIDLKRPVARYELIADDVTKFLKKIAAGEVKGKKFTITVRYTSFFYTGFNALDEIAKNALQYISYSRSIVTPEAETKEVSIAFDHVFVPSDGTGIPIAVEVTDESGTVVALTYLLLGCKADESCIIRSNFLTADPSGGIGFDPDYDGSIKDEIEVE
ncbi:DUF6562 domain-containing protein [Bacteroides sp.]|uniref:DUF6562 domain-containing protein n=1 Tax=Bacteroides sp. TaxID=29523 RepID=UPI00262A1CF0|nr:DUF6562 domain-containing protein [Bacteroides sp.]